MTEMASALIGASVGIILAVVQATFAYFERRRANRDHYFLQAFQYFDGGTQRRNIGISMIEGLWQVAPHLKGMFVPLLTNQAIYLLAGSEQAQARHERDNLRRVLNLLLGYASVADGFQPHYRELLQVLREKKAGQISGGVTVQETQVDSWAAQLVKCSG